jgi:hypothetical protein
MLALKQQLKELDSQTFHDLCFHVLKSRFPGLKIRQVGGLAGDEGIDVFAGQLEGRPCIWQCKNFTTGAGKSQKEQIRQSLRTALKHFSPRIWVLCIPVDLDVRAHRWFQRLQHSYEDKVPIGLMQGSDICFELLHNGPILRSFFPRAVLDVQEIKAFLKGTANYTEDQLEKLTEANVEEYIQRLRDKYSRFTFRITFPPPLKPQSLHELEREKPIEGLVLSIFDEHKRVDVIARDIEALNMDPPKIVVEIKGAGVQKFQDALRTGAEVEFKSDEIGDVRSSPDFPIPKELRPTKFVMGPSAKLQRWRLPTRVTLSRSEESVVYDLVEFMMSRKGTEEFELSTVDRESPLQLSIVVRHDRNASLNVKYNWENKEVRKVQRAVAALKFMSKGGRVEIVNLNSGQRLFRGELAVAEPPQLQEGFEEVITDLAEVADAFDTPIRLNTDFTKQDEKTLHFLLEVARKGRICFPPGELSLNLVKSIKHVQPFMEWSKEEKAFYVTNRRYEPVPRLFGVEIDTGPCSWHCPRTTMLNRQKTVQKYLAAKEGESVKVKVATLEPVELTFRKFIPGPDSS